MFTKNFANSTFCLAGFLALTACSSGSDLSTTVAGGGRGGNEYGFVTLSITDAPIDFATEVWVQFDGVEFMPSANSADQTPILIMFDTPVSIDLLQLQGSKSKDLLVNEILPTGHYDWVSLKVTAVKDGVLDSYMVMDDGTVHELDMPPGSEVGLDIVGGLEIIANTPSAKTVDFDLRKSIVTNALGEYQMQPVLSIVNNEQSGTLEGSIRLKTLLSSNCSDWDPMTHNAVYLYEGFNVTPDDFDGIAPDHTRSAMVSFNKATGKFEFSFGFVPFGKYTAAFTCEADLDDAGTDDAIRFSTTKNVNIANTGVKTLASNTFRFSKSGNVNWNGNDDDDDDDD